MDYVSQKGISSYVEFVGVVKDVDRYLAQSKIFAFVSDLRRISQCFR